MHFSQVLAGAAVFCSLTATTLAAPAAGGLPTSFIFPTATKNNVLTVPQNIAPGATFDGKMESFDRGVSCTGQAEGGNKDAVFILADGATLKNAIIGPNQIEGVHCLGACTIENVFWPKVCEDALSLKGPGNSKVIGGGAKDASDKVIQHNGIGNVDISGFAVQNFGKLYRSCGNCKTQGKRTVTIANVLADQGKVIAGVNSNFDDVVTLQNVKMTGVKQLCDRFEGTTSGEPTKIGSGPDGKAGCGEGYMRGSLL
ncbi:pectate lyase [Powellomyces hirtus]|nr:pectate lyase [Powellomyces hirtus]